MNLETGLFIMAILGNMIVYWTTLSTKKRILLGIVWVASLGTANYGVYFAYLMLWVLFNVFLHWGKVSLKILFLLNVITAIALAAYITGILIIGTIPVG